MDSISFTMENVIMIGGFLIVTVGFYWKIRVDINGQNIKLKQIDVEIEDIKTKREAAWEKHTERDEKSEEMHAEILRIVAKTNGDIRQVKTDISWLKER